MNLIKFQTVLKNEAMYQRETFLEDLSQKQRNIPRINVIQGESFDLNKQNWILLGS